MKFSYSRWREHLLDSQARVTLAKNKRLAHTEPRKDVTEPIVEELKANPEEFVPNINTSIFDVTSIKDALLHRGTSSHEKERSAMGNTWTATGRAGAKNETTKRFSQYLQALKKESFARQLGYSPKRI